MLIQELQNRVNPFLRRYCCHVKRFRTRSVQAQAGIVFAGLNIFSYFCVNVKNDVLC